MRNIIILGQGPGWQKCPYDKEVWTLNMGVMRAKKVDKIFFLDPIEDKTDIKNGTYTLEQVKERITRENIQVVSAYKYDFPNIQPFPIRELVKKYGSHYFANSIAFMIAYALLDDTITEIDLYGVNQAAMTEYIYHKGSVEFWLGMAVMAGVAIRIHGNLSQVLRTPNSIIYGYRQQFEHIEFDDEGYTKYKRIVHDFKAPEKKKSLFSRIFKHHAKK